MTRNREYFMSLTADQLVEALLAKESRDNRDLLDAAAYKIIELKERLEPAEAYKKGFIDGALSNKEDLLP